MKKICANTNGFTLVEVLLVMGIFSVLSGFIVVNLMRPQMQSSIDKTTDVLIADIKRQQSKAMLGEGSSTNTPEQRGIYFDTNSYTLFKGNSYSTNEPDNFVVELESGAIFSNINLPNSQIVFSQRSGEVENYSSVANTIEISHDRDISTTQISINEYGALTIN